MAKAYCLLDVGSERMSKEVCSLFTKKDQHKGLMEKSSTKIKLIDEIGVFFTSSNKIFT